MAKKTPQHYVDNQRMLAELITYRKLAAKCKAKRKPKPRLNEYLGECFLKIATHLSYKPNFVNYTFRDDMISDGIENCLVYVDNFNPEKSKNPFGYFTQIIFYAFIRRIQKEKKHTFIKYKLLEKAIIDGSTAEGAENLQQDTSMLTFDNVQDFINRYEDYSTKRRERRRTKKQEKEELPA